MKKGKKGGLAKIAIIGAIGLGALFLISSRQEASMGGGGTITIPYASTDALGGYSDSGTYMQGLGGAPPSTSYNVSIGGVTMPQAQEFGEVFGTNAPATGGASSPTLTSKKAVASTAKSYAPSSVSIGMSKKETVEFTKSYLSGQAVMPTAQQTVAATKSYLTPR